MRANEEWQRLGEILGRDREENDPEGPPPVVFRHVTLAPIQVTFSDPGYTTQPQLARLEGAQVDAVFDADGGFREMLATGRYNQYENPQSLRLLLRAGEEDRQVHYTLLMDAFDSTQDLPRPISPDLRVEGLEMRGTAAALNGGGEVAGTARLAARQMTLRAGDGSEVRLGSASVEVALRGSLETRELTLEGTDRRQRTARAGGAGSAARALAVRL